MDTSVFDLENFFDISTFPFSDIFKNVKYPWEVISQIESFILQKISQEYKPNFEKDRKVFIGQGTTIEEGAYIKGPGIIGKNCFIAHGAYLREGSILGDNVHIGHSVEIKNSIILNDSHISHFNYIGDSVIGNHVNIAGGALLANYRLDKKSVIVRTERHEIETHLKKFGAIVGDFSVVGVNSVLNPGTILGKKSIVYPLKSVKGVYTEGSLIQ